MTTHRFVPGWSVPVAALFSFAGGFMTAESVTRGSRELFGNRRNPILSELGLL